MPYLVTVSGSRIPLRRGQAYSLGRGMDCDIVVEFEAGSIRKSPKALIVARLLKLRGTAVGDLRQFVVNAGGEWVPTRAGISLPRERLSELRELVERLIAASQTVSGSDSGG